MLVGTHSFLLIYITPILVWGLQFDVLKVSNVPFPVYGRYVASASALYHKNISEFTLCYRFQVESYNENDKGIMVVAATAENFFNNGNSLPSFWTWIFPEGSGREKEGFQAGSFLLRRIVPPKPTTERGLNFFLTFPSSQQFVLARNVGTGKWYHLCHSFSTILMRILRHQESRWVKNIWVQLA